MFSSLEDLLEASRKKWIDQNEIPDERLLKLRYNAKALTGHTDLMVCETADDMHQFILTGQPPEMLPA